MNAFKKSIKILILTTKWGHLSIAEAVKDSLAATDYETCLEFIPIESFSDRNYTTLYRYFPGLSKIPFRISEIKTVSKILLKFLYKMYSKKVKSAVDKHNPQVIINTHFAFIPTLERIARDKKFLFLNIVADPKTFNKIEITQIGYNFVFDKAAEKKCQKLGVSKDKIIQSGWFVRNQFSKPYTMDKIRKELELKRDVLTLCVVGGSEGTYGILKILPAFLIPPKKVQVVMICGNNKNLLDAAKTFANMIKMQNGHQTTFIPLGYTNNIHEYLMAADLVIGKAGPNLLFETVATRTPFMVISHIAGQEDGNLEIIKKHKLGFVEENPIKAISILRKIIKNPKLLEKFNKTVNNEAEKVWTAPAALQKLLENWRTKHL